MIPEGPKTVDLFGTLTRSANPQGGWSYYRGKASRLEPTCWALLALGQDASRKVETDLVHRRFLEKCHRPEGWLVEDVHWPINIAFNALVAFTWLNRPDFASEEKLATLLRWLTAAKGVQAPESTSYRQDNSLQGWSWLDATFSWVEPTAWGILALHKGIRARLVPDVPAGARIAEGERLLMDRCCRDGGWNFGNANVMGQDLFPHVPTTAIALLALQGRREESAVVRSLAFLESHWTEEASPLALGLSLICLRAYGRPLEAIKTRLQTLETQRLARSVAPSEAAEPLTNMHGLAVALTALSLQDNDAVFRI
jgi:hypothetical protein